MRAVLEPCKLRGAIPVTIRGADPITLDARGVQELLGLDARNPLPGFLRRNALIGRFTDGRPFYIYLPPGETLDAQAKRDPSLLGRIQIPFHRVIEVSSEATVREESNHV